ncbi:MAG: hypothetical protein ACLFT5_08425 [Desulfovermiculus sp.]
MGDEKILKGIFGPNAVPDHQYGKEELFPDLSLRPNAVAWKGTRERADYPGDAIIKN